MLYFLSFLLSWLSGMLVILITAFFLYDEFSIIDITSFASLTFAGFLFLFLLLYFPALRLANKKALGRNQFIIFPIIFSLIANLPVYVLIWKNMEVLYGSREAILFTAGFLTSGFVFGLFRAWQDKVLSSAKRE